MLDYSPRDAALLVALDRLQLRLADLTPDADGFCLLRGRWGRDLRLLAPVLEDRRWAVTSDRLGVLRLRLTPAGTNELTVFRARSSAAAARARGERVEEWHP
jgi:hypothetical protein